MNAQERHQGLCGVRVAHRKGGTLAVLAAAVLALLALEPTLTSAADCSSLASMVLKDTTITSATVVPAMRRVPEYCKVLGSIHNLPQSTILFEVALPTKWNGKYFVAGGGGYNGTIPRLDQALIEGYAAAGSDTGHVAVPNDVDVWALNNLDTQNNYGYLATHVVTLLGKDIVRAFYGQRERRSYFVGCSNGGKMALMEVQRYPDDFDGAVSGDPVIDRTKLMMQFTWNAQALAAAPIPPSKIPVIEKATLKACNESGGVINGLIMTPGRCKFDPKAIICTSGDGPNCLTAGQAQALQKLFRGPVNSAGVQLYPGFVPGHEEDYPSFMTGTGKEGSEPSQWRNQNTLMRYFIFGPSFDPVKQFNFDTHMAALAPLAGAQDAANPDLSAFKAHGGKLIMYHGWADHSITPIRSIQYYAAVIDVMGKREDDPPGDKNAAAVNDFYRLFMEPGMHHCGNGPGPNVFGGANQGLPQDDAQHNVVKALDRWVEDGIAPEKIIASHLTNGVVDRTLPMCPYPQTPVYNGAGDVNMAESYHCEERGFWWALEGVQSQSSKKASTSSATTRKPGTP